MECPNPKCKCKKMLPIASSSTGIPGDISTYHNWCPECGTYESHSDWGGRSIWQMSTLAKEKK